MDMTVPYTHTTSLTFALEEGNTGEVVSPASVAADRDEAGGIARALDEPLGTPVLEEMVHPGQQVLILSDDNTRPTPTWKILPSVLERLRRAGVAEKDIEILIAAGTHRPMTDEEIVAEIRIFVSCLDEIHSYFSCGDYSPNLLMEVNGYLDEKKPTMLSELGKFLSLTPEQKKVYSLIRRSNSRNYPVDLVFDERVMKQVLPEIEKLERDELDGFNRYIETLMSYMIPQPQTDEEWD